MVFNRQFQPMLAIALFLFLASFVSAQEGGYFLDTSGAQPRLFQRLYWFEEEYTLFYEVVIQKEDGEYMDFLRESTVETFLIVSLPPGKYRYGVVPRDLLGQTGEMSEWRTFEVFPAFQPSIEKIYPSAFYLDERSEKVLDITGNNLLEESEIYLRSGDSFLFPVNKIVWDGKRTELFFDNEALIPGTYDIYIRNPGGFETAMEGFIVKYKKPVDLFMKIFWVPVIPIYGEMYDVLGSGFFTTGAAINFEAVSSKLGTFNGGMEFAMSGHILNSIKPGFEEASNGFSNSETGASWLELDLNILLRKQFFKKRMAVTFRFGLGISSLTRQEEYAENRYAPNETILNWNLGLSYMLLFYDIFYFETGIDFSQYNTSDASGFIKPRLGVGWQF